MLGDGDLEAIFENGDFDTAAVFGGSISVNGWFQGRTEAAPFPGGEIEVIDASFTCATSQVSGVLNDMAAVIDGETYTVKRKQKVGPGMSLIYLKT
jgi:hypothetical protein